MGDYNRVLPSRVVRWSNETTPTRIMEMIATDRAVPRGLCFDLLYLDRQIRQMSTDSAEEAESLETTLSRCLSDRQDARV